MESSIFNILEVHHGWDEEEPGGIVAMMKDLMDGLIENGHKISLLANDWNSTRLSQHTDKDGRAFYRLNLVPVPNRLSDFQAVLNWIWRFPIAVWELRGLCREKRIDIVQVHYADSLYLAFTVLRCLGGPRYVVTVHRGDVMGYSGQPFLKQAGYQRVMAGCACVVAVSRFLARKAQEISPCLKRIEVAHNGYTPPYGSLLTRAELERELGTTLPPVFATLVGNCRHYKGQDIALLAWAKMLKDGQILPLIIVGGGPDLLSTQAMCSSLGLEQWVTFTGPRSRHVAASLTAHAMMQVVPSRNEGQGIVILEAGHAGTPVICSDIDPFLEMIEPGETAAVFPVEDAALLADQVTTLLRDPEAASSMGQRLQKHVRENFSAAAMVDRYCEIFRVVMETSS